MKICEDVLGILSVLDYPTDRQVRIVEKLDKKRYTKANAVLEALGGKWSRGAQAHVFGSDARVRIEHAITTGEVETGQDVGHFPTPAELAARLVAMADVRPGMLCLEPSAGDGALVWPMLAAGAEVHAVEHDPARRHALRARSETCKQLTVSFMNDFMLWPAMMPDPQYDRVVMNPPFCKVGEGDHLDHVRRAHRMLKSGGRLVAVLPSSVAFRRDRRYSDFRGWASEHTESATPFKELPVGSFKESGTGVNTVVAVLEAP